MRSLRCSAAPSSRTTWPPNLSAGPLVPPQLTVPTRDEAHRFAITHHRKVRSRKALTSPLDSVEGIGPARKRALLRHFGSVQAIRDAAVEEIVALGVPERLAKRLKETL